MPAISLFAACLNRNVNLCSVLPSWLACEGVAEIVIVDWNSDVEVVESIRPLFERDARIRVIRVTNHYRWYPAAAFNLGAFACSGDVLVKMDVDTLLGRDSLTMNPLAPGTFRTGRLDNPAHRGQQHLYGIMMAHREDFRRVNGFNELLKFYGWADSDIFDRLAQLGLTEAPFEGRQLEHLHHSGRTDNAYLNHFAMPVAASDMANAVFGIFNNRLLCKAIRWDATHPRLEYDFTEAAPRYRIAAMRRPAADAAAAAAAHEVRREALQGLLTKPVPMMRVRALPEDTVQSLDDATLAAAYALVHSQHPESEAAMLLQQGGAARLRFLLIRVREFKDRRRGVIGLTRLLTLLRDPALAGAFVHIDSASVLPSLVLIAKHMLRNRGIAHAADDRGGAAAAGSIELRPLQDAFGDRLEFREAEISGEDCAPIEPSSLRGAAAEKTVILQFTRHAEPDVVQAALSIVTVGFTLLAAENRFELVVVTNGSAGAGAAQALVRALDPDLAGRLQFVDRLPVEGLACAREPYFADQDQPYRALRVSPKLFREYALCLLETGYHPISSKDAVAMAKRINHAAALALASGSAGEAASRQLAELIARNADLVRLEAASRQPEANREIARALLVACYRQWLAPAARLRLANSLLLALGITPRSFIERVAATHPDFFAWLAGNPAPARESGRADGIAVTLIVSLFKAGDFLPAFMKNLGEIANLDEVEVLFFDANPGTADFDRARPFLAAIPNYRYFRVPVDPGLYTLWNIGVHLARGELVGNANVDDLRAPDHVRVLADVLRSRPEVSVACSSLKVTSKPATSWKGLVHEKEFYQGVSFKERFGIGEMMLFRNVDQADRSYQTRCIPHCLPLWRKSLHPELGLFNETLFGYAADYEFWLRVARRRGDVFWLEKQLLGMYYVNESSYMRRNEAQVQETRKLIFLSHFRDLYKLFFSGWPAVCE